MRERLKEIDSKLESLNNERKELCMSMALLGAKFNVGDRIMYEKDEIWEVSRIESDSQGEPVYFGSRIKKDGNPGKAITEIWQTSFYEFVKVI